MKKIDAHSHIGNFGGWAGVAKAYTIHTSQELREALADAKKQTKSCLFDIKVLPKTMTPGFESWWRVGVAEVSKSETVAKAYEDMQAHIKETFDY